MGTITINGKKYTFTDEKNVLTIIRKAGIDLPTLCYHSDLSTFGACRLCTVENDRGQCFASCSEEPREVWSSIPIPSGCAVTASSLLSSCWLPTAGTAPPA